MTIYRGLSGVNREVKQQYRGLGGVNREIKEQYRGLSGVNRKVFAASMLSKLSIGSKVKFGTIYGNPIIWLVADQNHSGYPSNSVTLVAEKIIKIMCYDAIESSNADSNRKTKGNNRWLYSNLRSWLNSSAAAGAWYAARHTADASPTSANVWSGYNAYASIAGFLNAFSAAEIAGILDTSIISSLATLDGGGTESDTCKVFCLSATEVGLTGLVTTGTVLSLFNTASYRTGYPTSLAISNSGYTDGMSTSGVWWWWLRDALAATGYDVYNVNESSVLGEPDAYNSRGGLRPALNLMGSLSVSEAVDADGCYTLI